jgi:hypothetical protein
MMVSSDFPLRPAQGNVVRAPDIRLARVASRQLTRGSRILQLTPDTEPFVYVIVSSAHPVSTINFSI